MIDNPSNPPNPGVTRRAPRNHPEITQKSPRNRIWKDPSFWKGFLLGTGKGKDKRVTVRLLEGVLICPIPKNFGI